MRRDPANRTKRSALPTASGPRSWLGVLLFFVIRARIGRMLFSAVDAVNALAAVSATLAVLALRDASALGAGAAWDVGGHSLAIL